MARLNFPGKKALSIAYLAGMMFPPILIGVPVYVLFARLQLIDTFFGLILIYTSTTIPFSIWLLRGFFKSIPPSLDEAALVDGCNRIDAFFRVILPLSLPGLVVSALFSFLMAWNDTLFALILTNENMTVSVKMLFWITGWYRSTFWPGIMAGGFLAILPPVVIFVVLQRRFIQGMTAGAVKG